VAHHHRQLAVLTNLWREGDLKLVACKVGKLHLGNIKLSGSTRQAQMLEQDKEVAGAYSNWGE
jgi:hypothetical protein